MRFGFILVTALVMSISRSSQVGSGSGKARKSSTSARSSRYYLEPLQLQLHSNHKWRLENPETHHHIRHGDWMQFQALAAVAESQKLQQHQQQYNKLATRSSSGGGGGSSSSSSSSSSSGSGSGIVWPTKLEAVIDGGDLILGGLMMVHEREDSVTCGPIMPQGGIQALEAMLYTLDRLNAEDFVPGVKIGAHVLDDCDKDTYGLEMAVDFIKVSVNRDVKVVKVVMVTRWF
ncbi:hypothetical protein TKK_0006691 [Trichogramma kaykai]